MSAHWYVDFTGLLPDWMQTNCEQEFQRQMQLTDGELFVWYASEFQTINLSVPGTASQAILQYFSCCGCPISGIRLAISLYPSIGNSWPIRSADLSLRYLFDSLEILLNIRAEPRVKEIIYEFEKTDVFIQARHLAQVFIHDSRSQQNFCPEIVAYINEHRESKAFRQVH